MLAKSHEGWKPIVLSIRSHLRNAAVFETCSSLSRYVVLELARLHLSSSLMGAARAALKRPVDGRTGASSFISEGQKMRSRCLVNGRTKPQSSVVVRGRNHAWRLEHGDIV